MVRFGLWLFCVLDFIIGGSMAGPEVGRKLLRVSLGDGDIRFGDKVRGLVPTSAILETDTEEFGVLAGDELIHRIRESVSEEEYRRNVNIVVEDVDRLVANGPKQVKLDDVGDKAFYRAFRSYDDVIARERLIASRYEHVKYESIGSTAENREIGALFIGRPDAEKVFIKTGTLHAREWIAPMSTLFTAEVFASILGDGSRYPDVQVIVIPLVNPDGYEYTKQNRFWRKNRDVHTAERHKSCPGVDLNRNWGVGFGSNGGGATANPCGETYHGISAFSAPESKALRDLFAKIGFDRITGHLDVHSYGWLVLSPWFYTRQPQTKSESLENLGRDIATAMTSANNVMFEHGNAAMTLYLANGAINDWLFERNIPSFTLEMRGGGREELTGFVIEEGEIEPAAFESCYAMMQLVAALADGFRPTKCAEASKYHDLEDRSRGDGLSTTNIIIIAVVAGVFGLALIATVLYIALRK